MKKVLFLVVFLSGCTAQNWHNLGRAMTPPDNQRMNCVQIGNMTNCSEY